jgi:hypothetical protein
MAAARITLADVQANIRRINYFTAADGVYGADGAIAHKDSSLNNLTFCVITLRNGTRVVGINYGAIDPAQQDSALAHDEAYKNAVEQIWPLMGYELRTKLANTLEQA